MGITYELLDKLEKLDYFKDLLRKGIISTNHTVCKQVYDFYLEEKKNEKGKQLITNVSEQFDISERSVYRIIQKMED